MKHHVQSVVFLVLAFCLMLELDGSAPKTCGQADGSGKTVWNGDCAGSQIFRVERKKLLVTFEFPNPPDKRQNIKWDIGGCTVDLGYTKSNTNTAIFSINGNNSRDLPTTAEITADKVVFKKDGQTNITVSCRPQFDAIAGSAEAFKIAVKYEPTDAGQLKGLKMTYEAPIFIAPDTSVVQELLIWIIVSISAGVCFLSSGSSLAGWLLNRKYHWFNRGRKTPLALRPEVQQNILPLVEPKKQLNEESKVQQFTQSTTQQNTQQATAQQKNPNQNRQVEPGMHTAIALEPTPLENVPQRIMPRILPLSDKAKRIRDFNLFTNKNDYPTMDDVVSDY